MRKNLFQNLPALAAAFLVAFLAGTSTTWAHQQWISPNFFINEAESAWVTFDHTFSDQRFLPGSGPSSYYHWWVVGADGVRRPIQSLFIGQTRVVGEVELKEAGTYRLEAVERNMAWTQLKINGEDVWNPGSRSDFPDAEIVASRLYFQKAVTYTTLGTTTRTVLAATNDPLEIVFEDHPNELKYEKPFRVRVLSSGQPVAKQEVSVYRDHMSGHDASATCTTDAEGYCEIKPPGQGRLLLNTRMQSDEATVKGVDGYTYTYAVLVNISN